MTQSDYIALIRNKTKDEESRLDEIEWSEVLQEALSVYNTARPNTAIEECTGDGSSFLNVPSAWEDGFSTLARLDALDSDGRPAEIRGNQIALELRPSAAPRLYWELGYFSCGVTYRLRYTLAHTISDEASTVPAADERALVALAASLACTRLAAAYVANLDPAMGSVTIDQQGQTQKFRNLAKDYRVEYDLALGSGDHAAKGRGHMKTWVRDSPLLLHP